MRYFFLIFILAVFAIAVVSGIPRGGKSPRPPLEFFPDMDNQPKVRPQESSRFFSNGQAARIPIPGTVPISAPARAGDYAFSGKMGANWGTGMPFPITEDDLLRGRQRFMINCAVCHGPQAKGNGIAHKYGVATVANLQEERFRTMDDGEIFNTITYGKSTMGPYGANITPEDRWRIIAFLRTLQLSQNATVNDVPENLRGDIMGGKPAAAPAAPAPATPPHASITVPTPVALNRSSASSF